MLVSCLMLLIPIMLKIIPGIIGEFQQIRYYITYWWSAPLHKVYIKLNCNPAIDIMYITPTTKQVDILI